MDVALEDRPELAELVARVERGEEVAITRSGRVVARIEHPAAAVGAVATEELLARFKAAREGFRLGGDDIGDLLDRRG